MATDHEFETETMAGIYADQGHYDKAIAIYERLAKENPERGDLQARIEALGKLRKDSGDQRLSDHFSEWIELLLKKKQIDKLRNLKKN
jgi:tetratricopeptide (TPR) repeat protein